MPGPDSQNATLHQSFQPMPRLDTPVVNPGTGKLDPAWYRWFVTMSTRIGLANANANDAAALKGSATTPVTVYNTQTGQTLGTLQTNQTPGAPAQVLTLAASPFIFSATVSGLLVVDGGQVEIRRPPGGFHPAGLVGGAFRLLAGDSLRVSWFTPLAPPAVWLPDSQ